MIVVFCLPVDGDGFVDTSVRFVHFQQDMNVVIDVWTELWQGSISLFASFGLSRLAEVVVILAPCAFVVLLLFLLLFGQNSLNAVRYLGL